MPILAVNPVSGSFFLLRYCVCTCVNMHHDMQLPGEDNFGDLFFLTQPVGPRDHSRAGRKHLPVPAEPSWWSAIISSSLHYLQARYFLKHCRGQRTIRERWFSPPLLRSKRSKIQVFRFGGRCWHTKPPYPSPSFCFESLELSQCRYYFILARYSKNII